MTKRRRQPLGQSIGGVLFGFEQQVFHNVPPPHELVHHARPDAAVPAGDGTMLAIVMPDDERDGRTTMDEMELRDLEPQWTVAVRLQLDRAELDLAAMFRRYLPLIGARIAEAGVAPSGAPFGRYHQWDPERADVEIGIVVPDAPEGLPMLADVAPGEIGVSSLPGGLAGVALYRGTYSGLPAVYGPLHDWLHAQGHDAGEGPWESFIDDPAAQDPATVRTEVVWPVA